MKKTSKQSSKTRLRPFNELGCRPLDVQNEEFLCHSATEHRLSPDDEHDSVLSAECRIIITTTDGRVWNSVVDVELHPEQ